MLGAIRLSIEQPLVWNPHPFPLLPSLASVVDLKLEALQNHFHLHPCALMQWNCTNMARNGVGGV